MDAKRVVKYHRLLHQDRILIHTSYHSRKGYSKSRKKILKHRKNEDDI